MMFSIPFVPGSKKNAYRQRNPGQGGRPVYSAKAPQEAAIRAFLAAAMSRLGRTPIDRDGAVSLMIRVHEGPRDEDCKVVLEVFEIGPRKKTGRRGRPADLDGIVTTILDAMQGAVIEDDVQVTHITATRMAQGGMP